MGNSQMHFIVLQDIHQEKHLFMYFALFFQTFDINAFLKLDQDSTADLSKVSCIDDSVLHNTIKSQDGGHEGT